MAALCGEGQTTVLTNVLRSDDTERMLEALAELGVGISIAADDQTQVTVQGCAGRWPR